MDANARLVGRGAAVATAARSRLKQEQPKGPLVNRYRCKDGSFRWFEWRSVGDGTRELVYAAARDVTEQRAAEDELSRAKALEEDLRRQLIVTDRLASVGTLASGAAHEINNPLACVTANLGLLAELLEATDALPLCRTP